MLGTNRRPLLLPRTTGGMTWTRHSAESKALIPVTYAQRMQTVHLQIAEEPQIQTVILMTTDVFIRATRIQFRLSVSCRLTDSAATPGLYY